MINWIKFTFGSFFSNKYAREGAERSFWNVLFALFISLIILTAFFSGGYIYSMPTHYAKASQFKDFAYNAFASENIEQRIDLKFYKDSEDTITAKTVNPTTFEDEIIVINTFEDNSTSYKINDYDLVIDTRSSKNAYIDISSALTYTNTSTGETITPDDYRKSSNPKNYTLSLDFSTAELVLIDLTDDLLVSYTTWLDDYVANNDDAKNTISSAYNEIKALDNTSKEYKNQLHEFYTRYYYSINLVPTVQTYYQYKYTASNDDGSFKYTNYLVITDNWCLISFTNDKGINVTYDGYYSEVKDGFMISDSSNKNNIDKVKENVDLLPILAFDSVASMKILYTGISIFRFMLYILISLIILGLFVFCMAKIRHRAYGSRYIGSFKTVSTFLMCSSALAGILAFILSFIFDNTAAYSIGAWGSLSIVAIRTFVFVIIEEIAYKKNPLRDNVGITSQIVDEDNLTSDDSPIDLSNVETGTKVFTNDKVCDDEDEKMELM